MFDERIYDPLKESMIKNMMVMGVLKPVLVRINGDIPEIIDGRQRVRCAREAFKRQEEAGEMTLTVPTIVKKAQDLTMMGIQISANEHRHDDNLLNKTKKLERLLAMGASDQYAANTFGVTLTTIRNRKKLLDCAPEILEAVENEELPASAAADLAVFTREQQISKLEELKTEAGEGNKVTTAQTTRIRREKTQSTAATKFKAPRKPVLKALVGRPGLDKKLIAALHWVLGDSNGSDIKGLTDALAAIERENKLKSFKISAAQQEIIDAVRAETAVVATSLNKKTVNALIKRGVFETFTNDDDGVEYVRLTPEFLAQTGDTPEADDADPTLVAEDAAVQNAIDAAMGFERMPKKKTEDMNRYVMRILGEASPRVGEGHHIVVRELLDHANAMLVALGADDVAKIQPRIDHIEKNLAAAPEQLELASAPDDDAAQATV